ncbi:hypothetical protein DFH06DRAFT_621630 [Mycena polygramma]|nr:hypothetical protein DFH06DRAFT_621630 [Mycena polygramma]
MFSFSRRKSYNYNRVSSTQPNDDCADSVEDDLSSPIFPLSVVYPTIFCGLSAIISVLILLMAPAIPPTSNLSLYDLQVLRGDLTNLRRPTQFMGLDKVNRTSRNEKISVLNFPFLVARVSQQTPHAVITGGPESHIMVHGLETRKIQISSTISTVIQFRTIDWMLEFCALRIRLPGTDNNLTDTASNHVEVYRINATSPLDINSLALISLPQQKEKLAALRMGGNDGFDWSYRFGCAMDTLQTFILTGGDSQTEVEWWQDKQVEIPSIHIIQQNMHF